MCGIAGVLNLMSQEPIAAVTIGRMVRSLQHRGPDESGMYLDPWVGLGHSRLSIIGLADGVQPLCNEDKSLWMVFNGEAFNYPELKKELEKQGHGFRTETDSEVVLHLFEEYGAECLCRINGQFSLAIWNTRTRELFLARDRLGVRPLFFTTTGDRFVFASEVKAIFQNIEVPRGIDPQSLCQAFTFWAPLSPSSIFKGIRELPPGHFLTIKNGHIFQTRYWSFPHFPQKSQRKGTLAEATEELRSLLQDAVRIRLRADVPVGAYLSGGLDSSILATLISQNSHKRLRTFSMSFQEDRFDEAPFQRELAAQLGTDHRQIEIRNSDVPEHFLETVWHCEAPLLRTSPVPLLLLSALVRKNRFKVVLTGEGADEIFAGYNIFREAKVRRFWARRPESRVRPLLLERLYPYVFKNPARGRHFLQQFYAVSPDLLDDPLFSHRIRWENSLKNTAFFSDDVRAVLGSYSPIDHAVSRLPEDFMARDWLSRAQFLESSLFLSNYLLSSQGDRVAMANSVEMRHPFLDYRLLDFAAEIPDHWKIKGLNEKYILKQAFRFQIPASIYQRTKQPYRAPIKEAFFGGPGRSDLLDLLTERAVKRAGYFDPQKTDHLVAKFSRGGALPPSERQNMALVGILSTQTLHHQFIEDFVPCPAGGLRFDKIVRGAVDAPQFS